MRRSAASAWFYREDECVSISLIGISASSSLLLRPQNTPLRAWNGMNRKGIDGFILLVGVVMEGLEGIR